ncbi:MAG: dihydrofolate reductase [Phycisphaerales bacterium]
MALVIISAMALNRVIGDAGGLPWKLPDDMAHFKRTTAGTPVIMGRRTFETDAGVLPGRLNIVVTRREAWSAEGVLTASSIEEATRLAVERLPGRDAFVIGGGAVYAAALPLADRLELTTIHAVIKGDTRFPAYDRRAFRLDRARFHPVDDRHRYAMTFQTLSRVREAGTSLGGSSV